MPCFFSLGDFQASVDQIEGNRDSVILTLELTKTAAGEVQLTGERCIPCYTLTEYENEYYVTIPLLAENSAIFPDYDAVRTRIRKAIGAKMPME